MNFVKAIVAAGLVAASTSAFAADITGAGATFPFPIYSKWADAYKKETGNGLNYQSIGSGGGIKQIQAKTVTFGATDAPLKAKDLDEAGLAQWPMVMGGIVPVVHLGSVKADELTLDGKTLADTGRLREAADVLGRAHTPERPNPSILSAQGSVADQMGDHAGAQGFYQASLKIRPDDPSVLSNLGLSYALSRNLPRAEQTLRDAVSQPHADIRVRQNLALVLALEGKFGEAEEVSRRDLTPIDAAANVQTIRHMIAESNTWRDIRKVDGKRG